MQERQCPTPLGSVLDPALGLPLHFVLDLGKFPDCREDIHSHIVQVSSPTVMAKLLFH